MPKVDFATLVFRGARFDSAAMPVDVLPELAAYRVVVLAVAKALYQQEHPGRQRLPKGFEAGFQLVLDGVSEGSAVDHISLIVPSGTIHFSGGLFERARDTVEDGIGAAARGGALPDIFREAIPRFSNFGRTLQGDERIIVAKPDRTEGATYDRHIRSRLLRSSMSSYEDDVDLLGVVREADRDTDGFRLTTREGARVEVRPSPSFLAIAVKALGQSTVLRVRGTGVFDANGVLQRITAASDVGPAEEDEMIPLSCPTPIEEQIRSLAALDDGWDDGDSHGYDRDQLSWLAKLLGGVVKAFQLPTPYIYPAPDGFARAEWSSALAEIVVNVDLGEQAAEVIAARVGLPSSFDEITLRLAEAGAESQFGKFIADHLATDIN